MGAKSLKSTYLPTQTLAELGKVTNVGDVELVIATTRSTAETTTEATTASWHAHAAAETTASTHTTAAAHHWSGLRESRFGLTILKWCKL
jgi:hypothetical protein